MGLVAGGFGDLHDVLVGRILPLEGVELFTERGGRWYRLGEHLPALGVPFRNGTDGVLLDRLLIPGKLSAQRPERRFGDAVRVGLVRDERQEVRPATAFRCSLQALACLGRSRPLRLSLLPCKGPGGRRLMERMSMPKRSSGRCR